MSYNKINLGLILVIFERLKLIVLEEKRENLISTQNKKKTEFLLSTKMTLTW